ncbi:hypothetical protein [Halalkalicoccus jeotgali]|uniref:Uncharacterized protein n=1 Tax=Halalkalicoccus jeotgali (strain DSM 18796 / CECT 7217 / JCM 14584 / KCTC 4019 / B3) TaxID=795797 RepID=D8JC51_HALJB|nr:hypothetical protein [Halalkalicoccus jeotgali]ADJ16958.1 hypothetical protein HacjB3_18078 [Halalkalicoccus jeotgali B3]ADJ16989.1 hypothetical protein HacjB3_18233 [Halalkalicoccus jeotgali B3]
MTRRSLEDRVDSLESGRSGGSLGIEFNHVLVMSRERAEREGREILGVADTPGDAEHVRVEP